MRSAWLAVLVAAACGGGGGAGDGDGGVGADAPVGGGADAGPAIGGWDPDEFDNVYEVGPGQEYAEPAEVPWESLGPSTLVRIHWREQPYTTKWVINTEATEAAPLVVTGVPDAGRLPQISGDGAMTRLDLNYWNEERSIIKVGGSNLPDDQRVPSWIYIEALDIAHAQPAYAFTDESGAGATFASNAAAIHVEIGDHVFIRGNTLRDAGNGLFTGSGSANVVVSSNWIADNGIEASIFEHNSYTESFGITFEYNHYGPLRAGCLGNNLKDRSAGTVVRYNWIEGGNRALDLVESDDAEMIADASYRTTFVYGNVLIEPDDGGNSQVMHYGGDGGDDTAYRKGTLHLYGNTIVSRRTGNTTLVRLSTNEESADIRDNIIAAGGSLGITDGTGAATLTDNWLQQNWVDTHGTLDGTVTDAGNLTGASPGFTDAGGDDYTLTSGSVCIGAAGPIAGAAAAHPLDREYVVHQGSAARGNDGDPDLGAFER